VLLRNTLDNGHHWLGIGLTGRPMRDAVGARLELEAGGRTFVRTVKGGGSYLSSADQRVIFGLSDLTTVKRLTVHWPSGKIGCWSDLSVDRYWYLTEGDPTPRPDSQRAAPTSPSAELRQRTEPGRPRS
jgi:enediyne biosynthesis protein E4